MFALLPLTLIVRLQVAEPHTSLSLKNYRLSHDRDGLTRTELPAWLVCRSRLVKLDLSRQATGSAIQSSYAGGVRAWPVLKTFFTFFILLHQVAAQQN